MSWPDKLDREQFEIDGFIEAYARLPGSPRLTVVARGERPDFVVRDSDTKSEYGVELTSVYLDDKSVPLVHKTSTGRTDIPFDRERLEKYESRLISAIAEKVRKAREGYDATRPLILAIYVNEYIPIYLGRNELEAMVQRNEAEFDAIAPFSEVIFWNLGNGGVFQVRPR